MKKENICNEDSLENVMKTNVEVSVICITFNHEKYLMNCLEGFVSQKTNFKYEVIVHDDASRDRSADIIKKYAQQYPDIIKPILQKENQYSKGVNIIQEIILPKCKGKYIAFCEGDDYWSDINKLQIQYDFMEKTPDCSMCVHNTVIHDLSGGKADALFYRNSKLICLTADQIFFGWGVHTSSYFLRKEFTYLPPYMWKYFFGDYLFLVNGYVHGKVYALPNIMSVYNVNNKDGMTYEMLLQSQSGNAEKVLLRKDFLNEFNRETHEKYSDIIKKRIEEIDFSAQKIEADYCIKMACNEKKTIEKARRLVSNNYYVEFLKKLSFREKIYFRWKYEGYKFRKIWWGLFVVKKYLRK